MELKEAIGKRRSIRFYKPWRPVEREKIQTILEAARLASRAVNAAYAKAIVIYRDDLDPEVRDQFKTPTTSTQLDLAPVWILWYGDMEAINRTNHAATLKELIDVGALAPSQGWTYAYIDDAAWAQYLQIAAENHSIGIHVVLPDVGVAMCQALLAAVDEGLGTQLTSFNSSAAKELFDVPDSWMPVYAQLVGYPAEDVEGGGQRPREPFEEDFFEGKYGNPFRRDDAVVDQLRAAGMIREPAPAPWRRDELRALAAMFELPE
jgi:nitroreductase